MSNNNDEKQLQKPKMNEPLKMIPYRTVSAGYETKEPVGTTLGTQQAPEKESIKLNVAANSYIPKYIRPTQSTEGTTGTTPQKTEVVKETVPLTTSTNLTSSFQQQNRKIKLFNLKQWDIIHLRITVQTHL